MKTVKTLSWLVVLLGAWEVVAPFILGYSNAANALWDALILGIALIILAGWAALANQDSTVKTLEWINVILGVWLIIAPFLVQYANVTAALWNDVVVGILVVVLAGWAALIIPGLQKSIGRHSAA
jgi:hypothetical protein